MFGVAIIVAVYIPIFTLEGIEGRMFRPMAFTVCAAVLGSLAARAHVRAAASAYLFARERGARSDATREDARWFVALRAQYARALEWALAHRSRRGRRRARLLAVRSASVPFLGTEFMPKLDEGYLLHRDATLPSASLAQGIGDLERRRAHAPMRSRRSQRVVTNLGRPHEATETMALNQADVYVTFKPKRQWRDALAGRADRARWTRRSRRSRASTTSSARRWRCGSTKSISGVKDRPRACKIFGDSLPLLQEKAGEIERVVDAVPGAEDVSVGVSAGAMQLEVDLDRAAIARYGLNVADVREAVETGIGGADGDGGDRRPRRYPVVVRLDAPYRSTPEAVGQTLIRDTGRRHGDRCRRWRGSRTVEGPEVIEHEGGQRCVVVQSNVRGRDLGSFVGRRAARSRAAR